MNKDIENNYKKLIEKEKKKPIPKGRKRKQYNFAKILQDNKVILVSYLSVYQEMYYKEGINDPDIKLIKERRKLMKESGRFVSAINAIVKRKNVNGNNKPKYKISKMPSVLEIRFSNQSIKLEDEFHKKIVIESLYKTIKNFKNIINFGNLIWGPVQSKGAIPKYQTEIRLRAIKKIYYCLFDLDLTERELPDNFIIPRPILVLVSKILYCARKSDNERILTPKAINKYLRTK